MDKKLTVDEIKDLVIPKSYLCWDSINSNCVPENVKSDELENKYNKPKNINSNKVAHKNPDDSLEIPNNADNPYDSTDNPDNVLTSIDSLDTIGLDSPKKIQHSYLLPVSVAESVTAGALSNALYSDHSYSNFFLGGIITSVRGENCVKTQKNVLGVDDYEELNNFANPFTTYTMAKNATRIFSSRIGISNTGYSLPFYRDADLTQGKCEINVKMPYAYICLYDALTDVHKILKVTNDDYSKLCNQKVQCAQMQVKIAMQCKKLFEEYCYNHKD